MSEPYRDQEADTHAEATARRGSTRDTIPVIVFDVVPDDEIWIAPHDVAEAMARRDDPSHRPLRGRSPTVQQMLYDHINELEARVAQLEALLRSIADDAWPCTGGVDYERWPGGETEVFSSIATRAQAALEHS